MPQQPVSLASPVTPAHPRLLLLVFLPFSTGYFLSFLFRSINAVIAQDLMRRYPHLASDPGR